MSESHPELAPTPPAAGGPADSATRAETLAGRYRILGLLGVGGMGTVYKVRDLELDETVALKTLRKAWIDAPGALDRFKREVKLARRVTHPNVARTFDIGEHRTDDDDRAEKFLTMEYVEGVSLARRIDERGALPLADAIAIAVAVASALEAAHAAGVVHRDLKPDNVLLANDGRVLVTDFGIARPPTGNVSETGIVGTPAYMAPEQVLGAAIDGRADLYALGLVIYEMIVGARAFPGDQAFAVAAARLFGNPPDPTLVRPGLPAPLADLVRALCARERGDRPASAHDVRVALEAQRAAPVSAPTPAPSPPVVSATARSLALSPLHNEGPADLAWLADGLTDDMLDALCMARGLRVRGRAKRGGDEDARAFGHRLGVELVVEGAVRPRGDAIRLVLRLSSVREGFQVWAARYDGTFGESLLLVDRAARELAGAIAGTQLAPAERASGSIDLELYVKTRRVAIGAMPDPKAILTQVRLAQQAGVEDPRLRSAIAYGLARAGAYAGADGAALIVEAKENAERAIALAPSLGEPWVALAHTRLHAKDSPGAARALRHALRNAPSLAEAHDLAGRLLTEADELDEALQILDRAIWLDGGLLFARVDRARIQALREDWGSSLHDLETVREMSLVHYIPSQHRYALWSGTPFGDRLPLVTTNPIAPLTVGAIASVLEHGAIRPEVLAALRAGADSQAPSSRPARIMRQVEAEVLAASGDLAGALAAIELAVATGVEDAAWIRRCPLFHALREDPAFVRAADEIGARAARVVSAWREG